MPRFLGMAADHPHILIVGNPEEFHVGAHFQRAARLLGWNVSFCDTRCAYDGPQWARALLWHCSRRPLRLDRFSQEVLEACLRRKPTHLLTTGLAPVRGEELASAGAEGIVRMNFLTDDPWNPMHHAPWFQRALRHYDHVFSPRRANLEDLRVHGCKEAHYLPFAYSPDVHFPVPNGASPSDAPDMMFAGGADADRLPYIRALTSAGLKIALYGGYWDRQADLKPYWRGNADLAALRGTTKAAKIMLCLVRRGNRDGHAMRSFEVPAMGGCMLTEETPEHREIFGSDGESVLYFRSIPEMVERTIWLLGNETERKRLAAAAHARVTQGHNTYGDRLATMLDLSRR